MSGLLKTQQIITLGVSSEEWAHLEAHPSVTRRERANLDGGKLQVRWRPQSGCREKRLQQKEDGLGSTLASADGREAWNSREMEEVTTEQMSEEEQRFLLPSG